MMKKVYPKIDLEIKMDELICKFCHGTINYIVVKESEKATEPEIEFCPFCGMSQTLDR